MRERLNSARRWWITWSSRLPASSGSAVRRTGRMVGLLQIQPGRVGLHRIRAPLLRRPLRQRAAVIKLQAAIAAVIEAAANYALQKVEEAGLHLVDAIALLEPDHAV